MDSPVFQMSEKVRKGEEFFIIQHNGLLKRELFAALALQGAIANPSHAFFGVTTKENPDLPHWVIANSIKAADQLLKELERTKSG